MYGDVMHGGIIQQQAQEVIRILQNYIWWCMLQQLRHGLTEIMIYMNNNIDDLMLYAITHYCPDVMVCATN